MNGIEMNRTRITIGLPHGSIPGPFLFQLYIKILDFSSENSEASMFADDTTSFNAKKNESFGMQPEVDSIFDWMTSIKLMINIDNCEVTCFGSGNPPPAEG